jgi:hypothetical protein
MGFRRGDRVKVIDQDITGTIIRYDGSKFVVLDDARAEWAEEGEEGVLVYRDYELEYDENWVDSNGDYWLADPTGGGRWVKS